MAYFRAFPKSGGGIASGTITLSSGENVTIQTGLSSITKFTIIGDPKWDGTYYSFTQSVFNRNTYATKYGGTFFNGNSAGGGSANIGTAVESQRCTTINSILGGNISIIAPSSGGYVGDFTWYAE